MHPQDARLFGPAARPALRAATRELSWLLGRGYASASSLKLVGDRHALVQRQRAAVGRCACGDDVVEARAAGRVAEDALRGETLYIDGFNVLTTLEVALSGGVVLVARDQTLRDVAGVHGSYRKVQETRPALSLLAQCTRGLRLKRCVWLLDRPVSNSGRLRALLLELGAAWQLPWEVVLEHDPDATLVRTRDIIATADGPVLQRAQRWFNLARTVVERAIPDAYVVDLSDAGDDVDAGPGART